MERFRRAVNGKRLFTADFKREQASRVLRGEVTVGELSRELALKFKTQELNTAGLLVDANTLFVTGSLNDGTAILGSDIIFLADGPNCLDQLP